MSETTTPSFEDSGEYTRIEIDDVIKNDPRYELPRTLYPDLEVKTPNHYVKMLDFLQEHFEVDVSQAEQPDSQRVFQILHANMTPHHRFMFFDDTHKAAMVGNHNKRRHAVNRIRKVLREVAPDGLDTELGGSANELA
jgi:hypothetical protein